MDYELAVSLKISYLNGLSNTVQNLSKSIDLLIRIELTRAILMPRFSNFLRNSTIHFHTFWLVFMFGNSFRKSRGFVVVPVTKSNNFVSLY